jgi:hypothetical protein
VILGTAFCPACIQSRWGFVGRARKGLWRLHEEKWTKKEKEEEGMREGIKKLEFIQA